MPSNHAARVADAHPQRRPAGTAGPRRLTRWLLLGLTAAWLLLGAFLAGRDEGASAHWVWGVILAQVGGGLLVALTVWSWRRQQPGRCWFVVVLLVAGICRLAAMSASKDLSDDAYRYHWDGKVLAHGINPYLHAPDDPAVAHLRVQPVDAKINHPSYRTCYPPLAQILFAVGYRLSPGRLTGLQLLGLLAELVTWWLLFGELKRQVLPATNLLLIAWSPLLVFQGYLPGHLDLLYLPFFVLFIRLSLRGHAARAGIMLGLACLIKPLPLWQAPAAWRELHWRSRLVFLLSLVVVFLLLYLPFRAAGLKLVESTWLMAREWSFNGSLATLFERWWPRQTAHIVAGALLCVSIGLVTWRGRDLLARMLLIQTVFIVCTPTLFPWYLMGMYPLLVLRPDPALLVLGILVPLADEVLIGLQATGTWAPATWVPWAEYLPFYGLQALGAWRGWGMFGRPLPVTGDSLR